jgi:hypothetical protein
LNTFLSSSFNDHFYFIQKVRPWAAKKGIQLIQIAVQHSLNLKVEDFVRLVRAVEQCMIHVIGDKPSIKRLLSQPNITNMSDLTQQQQQQAISSSSSTDFQQQQQQQTRRSNTHRASTTLRTNNSKTQLHSTRPRDRFTEACARTDNMREALLMDKKYIGKIMAMERAGSNGEQQLIQHTEVNFRWQLGLLIGKGSFGNVYSCVNLDTGEPLALKIIPFKMNDVKNVKEIADEINNVKDINHENLVKFYGAELHRKEILIFMEFCGDQCTLEKLCLDQSGLPEKLVREYTKSLLLAVQALHEWGVMHGDIKGANIFLKIEDPKRPEQVTLKLGDFGCSIKFKDPIDSKNSNVKATGFRGTFCKKILYLFKSRLF